MARPTRAQDHLGEDPDIKLRFAREAQHKPLFPHGLTASSRKYEWDVTSGEVFTFFGGSWDVRGAKRLIVAKPRRIGVIRVQDVLSFLPDPPNSGIVRTVSVAVALNWTRVYGPDVDLTVPILVAKMGKSRLPIDGWHRLTRARWLQFDGLPCVTLTDEETEAVLVRTPSVYVD